MTLSLRSVPLPEWNHPRIFFGTKHLARADWNVREYPKEQQVGVAFVRKEDVR